MEKRVTWNEDRQEETGRAMKVGSNWQREMLEKGKSQKRPMSVKIRK